jgi:hypothetical protein
VAARQPRRPPRHLPPRLPDRRPSDPGAAVNPKRQAFRIPLAPHAFPVSDDGWGLSEGLPVPSSGLWKRAEPRAPIRQRRIGLRSEADMQRAEVRRTEANVRREGMGSPELRRGLSLQRDPWKTIHSRP